MRHCAFLSTDNLEDFFVYDDLVKPHLQELGWVVEDVSWHDQSIDYNSFDIVVVRSTWDYQTSLEAFNQVLVKIEASSANLQNPLALMQWNFSKRYLRDLHEKRIPILPTLWFEEFDSQAILDAYKYFNCGEIIIKPWVSANADFTYRLSQEDFLFEQQTIKQALQDRSIMVQAFEKSILDNGEFSLFYFAGEFSHAICKRPAHGDFRVQEEHGGKLESIQATSAMLKLGKNTLDALPEPALYARVDILDTADGLAIIELELIEPSLYFNMDEQSAKRFALKIDEKYP